MADKLKIPLFEMGKPSLVIGDRLPISPHSNAPFLARLADNLRKAALATVRGSCGGAEEGQGDRQARAV
jgi:hypothetical protein